MGSSPIGGSVPIKNFQEFLMSVQEKCGKFECGQNQRRQLLKQFDKVLWSLAPPEFLYGPALYIEGLKNAAQDINM